MSRLDELIQEYCPDGVEYRQLKDCCNVLDKKRKPITKAARETGIYPYYGANGIQDYVVDYIFDGTFILVGEDGSVITPTGRPVVNWAEGKIWVNNHAHIVAEREGVLLRFLYHFIQTVDVTAFIHGNIPKFTGGDFKSLQVPIPPLPVQEEIVRILDTFTELTAELTAELQARKKQYEYYSEKVLNSYIVKDVTLSDILLSIHTGLNPRRFFRVNTDDAKNYYVTIREFKGGQLQFTDKTDRINDEAMRLCNNRSNLEVGDVLFSGTGTIGETYVIEKEPSNWNIKEGVYSLKPNKKRVLSKFLKYYLSSMEMRNKYEMLAEGGTVKSISMKKMGDLIVKLPSIEDQERIIETLDHFNTLCNNLTSGLPAEIESRQKQYEYYRDKLLTFKPLP